MSERQRPREYRSSGLWALQSKLAMVDDGQDWTDALGPAMAAVMREFRQDLVEALGGEAVVSPQQCAIVEICARTYLMVETLDAYILSMGPPVNKSTRSVFPVVIQRNYIADKLVKHLALLGLERRAKPVLSLREALAAAPLPVDDEPDEATLRDQEIERRATALGIASAPAGEEEP